MEAYEFTAKVENGVIPIPDELQNRIISDIKVIVLKLKPFTLGSEQTRVRKKSDLLLSPSLDTIGWRFNREDANER